MRELNTIKIIAVDHGYGNHQDCQYSYPYRSDRL